MTVPYRGSFLSRRDYGVKCSTRVLGALYVFAVRVEMLVLLLIGSINSRRGQSRRL